MDFQTKRRISDSISLKLMSTAAGLACFEPTVQVITRDTDLSPLQPLIGDHFAITLSGIVRAEDWLTKEKQEAESK